MLWSVGSNYPVSLCPQKRSKNSLYLVLKSIFPVDNPNWPLISVSLLAHVKPALSPPHSFLCFSYWAHSPVAGCSFPFTSTAHPFSTSLPLLGWPCGFYCDSSKSEPWLSCLINLNLMISFLVCNRYSVIHLFSEMLLIRNAQHIVGLQYRPPLQWDALYTKRPAHCRSSVPSTSSVRCSLCEMPSTP